MLFNSKLKSVEEKEIKLKELTEKEFNEINEDISKALNKIDKYDIDFFSSNNSSLVSNDGIKDNFKKSNIIISHIQQKVIQIQVMSILIFLKIFI